MNDETLAEAHAWLAKAQGDLKAAKILSSSENGQRDIAIYHCQQSAEKAIKSWLVFREVPFQKVHDLERLLEVAHINSCPLTNLDEHARILTPYAVEFRYPGDIFEPEEEELQAALQLAQEVIDCISSRMSE